MKKKKAKKRQKVAQLVNFLYLCSDETETPTKEIYKALKLKAEYEERKKQGDF